MDQRDQQLDQIHIYGSKRHCRYCHNQKINPKLIINHITQLSGLSCGFGCFFFQFKKKSIK
jgi:pyruvate-formate lyase-activating enzyme